MNEFPYPKPPPARPGERRAWFGLFFSPFGRIGRVTYLLLMPIVLFASVVLFVMSAYVNEHRWVRAEWLVVGLPLLLLFTAGGSLMLRRVHDIGFSSLMALLVFLPRVGWLSALPWTSVRRNNIANEICLILILVDILVMLVLVLWPGQGVANRHGAVPD